MLPPLRIGIKAKLVALVAALFVPTDARAILIADGFSYAGINGFDGSRALARDYANYPVFKAVGGIRVYEGAASFTGTGTLLNSEWVLTAGHNWNNQAVTGLEFILGGVVHAARLESRLQHPLWTNAPAPLPNEDVGPSQGWDVALFRLAAPITEAIVFPQLYTGTDELGKTGITLGAGITGTGNQPTSDSSNPSLDIYASMNVVDRLTAQTSSGYSGGLIATDFDGTNDVRQNTLGVGYNGSGSPWVWDTSTNTVTSLDPAGSIDGTDSAIDQLVMGPDIVEGSTAPGDSGGPTFIQDGGEWKLAGITSWGLNPWDALDNGGSGLDGLYGDVSYMTRVSQVAPWITSVVPEPSTCALLVMTGAGALWCAARRRRGMENSKGDRADP
jgi:hypothetical protein